jgi:hypothetical protein
LYTGCSLPLRDRWYGVHDEDEDPEVASSLLLATCDRNSVSRFGRTNPTDGRHLRRSQSNLAERTHRLPVVRRHRFLAERTHPHVQLRFWQNEPTGERHARCWGITQSDLAHTAQLDLSTMVDKEAPPSLARGRSSDRGRARKARYRVHRRERGWCGGSPAQPQRAFEKVAAWRMRY